MSSLTNFNLSVAKNLFRKRDCVIEASPANDRNMALGLSSLDVEGSPSMQTLGRPAERHTETEASRPRRVGRHFPAGQWLIATAVLAGWCLFVNMLEGFDFDTMFIAVFCTAITMFVLKSFTAALGAHPRF